MAPTHVLAIDVGSSSLRAGIFLPTSERVAHARLPRNDALSGLNFDADRLWEQVGACVNLLPAGLRSLVEAIGVTAHIGSVFLDRSLNVLARASGWADASGVDIIASKLGGNIERLLRVTGRPVLTGGPVAAALALRAQSARGFDAIAHLASPKDFINARLTGDVTTDSTSAAYFGAFDAYGLKWSEEILRELGLGAAVLPRVQPSITVAGALQESVARHLGLRSGLPVAAGGPDGTVGASFVLGGRSDHIADISGTTDVLVRVVTTPPAWSSSILINPYVDSRRWTVGGSTGGTGGALAYWSMMLGLDAAHGPAFEEEISSVPIGALGLVMKPFLTGSRFPRWRRDDRGAVLGVGEQHGRAHFLRAAAESITFVAREGIDVLAPEPGVPIILAGGIAKSTLLARMRADILGRPVLVVDEPDVSLSGAARLAIMAIEGVVSKPSMRPAVRLIEPDPDAVRLYEELYRSWQEN
ncbi:FGGY family carbohydrate kinase [Mesorhizobium sp.]|uniref:xylulokinase n=1 Tax=Mesorhizobium sp. TaxID=1871066 RepID=UPI000FE35506|nr:FGGY family carbohydrate kinase [Mesorhizobium sp.]RWH72445.1 MAG: xylulose kinase [Mesorhizobium sp.]RWL34671.1 MAG: xylulose kinase [Mesorhizobium sp.]RWL36084.1 MAG: xylulose kinase [Mesorhizobium sp.]RWL41495.1 MAG: xylulose kinase [Mesorhizobium sp.]RWL45112.1 MAG: xylulose kinase [Mesorhizobium sp.]